MSAPTVETFSLAALVHEVCTEADETRDPAQIAKEIHRRIPEHAYGEALAQALRKIVVDHLKNIAQRTRIERQPKQQAHQNGSAKVRAIREWWREAIRANIKIGEGVGDFKPLGECTVENLDFAAGMRENMARANAERAAEYRHLRSLLVKHKVTTVAELPEEVLAATLQPRRAA